MAANSGAKQAPRIELQIRQDGRSFTRIRLTEGRYSVGRDDGADVQLPSGHVSRHHFDLVVGPSQVQVVDAGSRNGIKVQGRKVQQAALAPGEIVAVPHFEMRFKWLEPPAPKRKDTIGGGWDDYLEEEPSERRSQRRDTDELPVMAAQEATPPPREERPSEGGGEGSVLSVLAARRATGRRLSLVASPMAFDADEDSEADLAPPGPPMVERLRSEGNVLLYNQQGAILLEVIHTRSGQVTGMELLLPGRSHWWGGRPRFAAFASPTEDNFPLVQYLREGRFRVSTPDNGRWKVSYRGPGAVEVARRGALLSYDAEWEDQVEIRHGHHVLHIRCVRQPPPPERVEEGRAPPLLAAVAALASLALHTGVFLLPIASPMPPSISLESYAEVTLDAPRSPPPQPEPTPPEPARPPAERAPSPPEPKRPKVARPKQGRPEQGAAAPEATPASQAAPRQPQYRPRKLDGPLLPDASRPNDEAPAAKSSVGVANFKVQGTIGHLPELKLPKQQERGAGREVFRGRRMRGAALKNLNLVGISPKGAIDGDAVNKAINRSSRKVEACYQKVLANSPTAEGRVDLSWTVASNGRVKSVRVVRDDLGSATMIQCLKKVVREMTFPPPATPEASITQPFTFRPPRL